MASFGAFFVCLSSFRTETPALDGNKKKLFLRVHAVSHIMDTKNKRKKAHGHLLAEFFAAN